MKRHPIRPLAAAALTAALLAPATASAAPAGWSPPPPPPGDGTSEVQSSTYATPPTFEPKVVEGGEPGYQLVAQTGPLPAGDFQGTLSTLHRHTTTPLVGLGDPPADEPQAPPKEQEGEDERSLEDIMRERNRMFDDAAGDEASRRDTMNRIMGGLMP